MVKVSLKGTSPYLSLRLKRHRYKKSCWQPAYYSVQQKAKNHWNKTAWITLAQFDSEYEALDFLEAQAEIIRIIQNTKLD